MKSVRLGVLLCISQITACVHRPALAQITQFSSETAPDSTPTSTTRELLRPENLAPLNRADTIVRVALWLRFRPNTRHTDRIAAITTIGGEVVGGYRPFATSEGYYLVMIKPTRLGADDVLDAIVRLSRLSQVAGALPYPTKPFAGSLIP